jgi:hypothetical protein
MAVAGGLGTGGLESSNKDCIRHLQSVNYALLDPLPYPLPNPLIKSGYNGVFCTDSGVDIVTQNFLPTDIGTPSLLEIQSTATNDEAINIITKNLHFTNKKDGTDQLIIDNEGSFVKEFDRDCALDVTECFINLQDWMAKIQEIVLRLCGLDGSGYSFGDLISDIFGVGSIIAQAGVFAAIYSALLLSLALR